MSLRANAPMSCARLSGLGVPSLPEQPSRGEPGYAAFQTGGNVSTVASATPWGAAAEGITSISNLIGGIWGGSQQTALAKQQAQAASAQIEQLRQARLTESIAAQVAAQQSAQRFQALMVGGLGLAAVGVGVWLAYRALKKGRG